MNYLFLNIPRENEYEETFFDDFYDYLLNKNHNVVICTDLYNPNVLDERIKKYFIPVKNLHLISEHLLINDRFLDLNSIKFKYKLIQKLFNKLKIHFIKTINTIAYKNKKFNWITDYDEQSQLIFEKDTTNFYDDKQIYGFRKLEKLIFNIINKNKIDCVIVFNDVDHLQFLGRLIAKDKNLAYLNYERSDFLGKFYRENEGFYQSSHLMNLEIDYFDKREEENSKEIFFESREKLLNDIYGYRKNQKLKQTNIKKNNKKLIFIPMENISYTGWNHANRENIKDYNDLPDPKNTLKLIDQNIDSSNFEIYIKPHPGCKLVDEEFIPRSFKLYNGKLENMLEKADVVIGFKSKLNLVFYYNEIPVIQLVKSPFTRFNIFKYSKLENLNKNLEDIYYKNSEVQIKFLSYYYEKYCLDSKENLTFFDKN